MLYHSTFGFVRLINVKNKYKLSKALNNVWIGECRVWAHEARYDRFAHNDSIVVTPEVAERKEREADRLVTVYAGKGTKNQTKGMNVAEKHSEGVNVLRIGKVVVHVGGAGKKLKVGRMDEGVGGVVGASTEEGKRNEGTLKAVAGADGKMLQQRLKVKVKATGSGTASEATCNDSFKFILMYKSCVEDRNWASRGMNATVIEGDSAVELQQRVEDAGFPSVVVIPLGSDRVFISCTGEEDIWQVFNGDVDFFSMLFSNLHKWPM